MLKSIMISLVVLFISSSAMADSDNLICQANGNKGEVACLSTKTWNTLQCKVDNNNKNDKEIVVHCNLPNSKEVYTVKAFSN